MNLNTVARKFVVAGLMIGSLLSMQPAIGQTIVVTTSQDHIDFGGAQQVSDLPGPDGRVSFREALRAADNTAGPQHIHFHIPQSQWTLPDRATLQLEGSFVLYSDNVIIDFSTQTEFTGNTNPDGNEVSIRGAVGNSAGSAAIWIEGNHNVVIGLDRVDNRGYGVSIAGDFNTVLGCTIRGPLYAGVRIWGNQNAPAEFNTIGGIGPTDGNILASGNAGVRIDAPADNNLVIGNLLGGSVAGVQVRGAPCCDIFPYDNRIGGPTPEERNVIGGSGYTGEHGSANGKLVAIEYAFGTILEGNYIGTEEDGITADQQIAPVGVEARDSTGTVIRNNLISGVNGSGVHLFGENVDTQIQGNLIGTDKSGLNPVPNWYGIRVSSFTSFEVPGPNYIGGLNPGDANTIAFNLGDGVLIGPLAFNTRISGNSIHSNGGLAIELSTWSGRDGVTPNDGGDGDSNGGSRLQNYPVLISASTDGTTSFIDGTFNSSPNADYSLEFFSNMQTDATGHGEGRMFLGSIPLTTDSNGDAAFSAELTVPVTAGEFISSTATNILTNDTSEFSNNVEVDSGGSVGLNSLVVSTGSLIAGDLSDLESSDDSHIRLQGRSGRLATQDKIAIEIEGQAGSPVVSLMDITIEANHDSQNGIAKIYLFNWNTDSFDTVATRRLGYIDRSIQISDISAANYVDSNGDIVLRIGFNILASPEFNTRATPIQVGLDYANISVR